jgi:F-box protein 11
MPLTPGILAKNCNVFIKKTQIYNCSLGGVHYYSDSSHTFQMKKGRVYDNREAGINLVGMGADGGAESLIEDVQIDNNRGPGIRVGIGNRTAITGCVIQFNREHGIELLSSSNLIKNNIIEKNYKNGIFVQTFDPKTNAQIRQKIGDENIQCDAEIYHNQILQNKNHGILCSGLNCNPRIFKKNVIKFNTFAGIKVQRSANPRIFENTIEKNLH